MNTMYEIFNEIANQTIENLDTIQDNKTKDKQYILDCIGKEEMFTLYSDGGRMCITGFMSHLHLHDQSFIDERLQKIRVLVDKRIDNVQKWYQLITNDTYDHEQTTRLLDELVLYLFDSELMTKYLLPNLFVPLFEKFGKRHPQEIVSLVVSKWSLMDRTYHITEFLDNLFNVVPQESLNVLKCLDEKGLELYNGLPDTFRVYRGCYMMNVGGYSWSTSKEIASRFPFHTGNYIEKQPVLVSGTVSKKDVLFCVGNRGEDEIVVNPQRVSGKFVRNLKRQRDTNHHILSLPLHEVNTQLYCQKH